MKEWRLLLDGPKNGYENMAADEAMLIACENGLSPSTLRFYEWDRPVLSIGCFQRPGDYNERCLSMGVPVVRRITGGGSVLHDMEITYSIVTSDTELFEKGVIGAYKVISDCMLEALRDIGINACINDQRPKTHGPRPMTHEFLCFKSISKYEILANGRKVIGSAQKRLKKAFLQHGSIIISMDKDKASFILGVDCDSITDGLGHYADIDRDTLMKSIIKRFEKGFCARFKSDAFTPFEMDLKDRLIEERYSRREWNISGSLEPAYNINYGRR